MTVYRINITWFYCEYHYLHLIIIFEFVSPSISIISSFSRWTRHMLLSKNTKNGHIYYEIGRFYPEHSYFHSEMVDFQWKMVIFLERNSHFLSPWSKFWIIFELQYVIIICLPSFKPSKPLPKSPICPHRVSFIKTIWKWGPPRSPNSLAPLHIPDSGQWWWPERGPEERIGG